MSDLSTKLINALADGACLVDSSMSRAASSDLKSVLAGRLSRYYTRLGSGSILDSRSLEEIQQTTAKEALSVIARIQQIISAEDLSPNASSTDPTPLIGTRDLAEIRILLSVVFKWGVEPLLFKVAPVWPTKSPSAGGPRIIDLTTTPEDYELLISMTSELLGLLFPGGAKGPVAQTLITTTILQKHVMDTLKPSIALGWLPKSFASESRPCLDAARPLTVRLLNLLSPSQTITALGSVMSAPPPLPHVRKACAYLLSQQLLRPQGVRGLCAAVFGEDEASTDDAPIEKLQKIAKILSTVPANMKLQEYFNTIVPRIMDLLSPQDSPTNKRVAAYAISRMLSTDDSFPHQQLISKIVFSIIHRPFFELPKEELEPEAYSTPLPQHTPSGALATSITLISNIDPSPTLISAILSPITSTLYSLLYYLDQTKTSDPNLKESIRGLLVTWGKIVGTQEGIDVLWSTVESDEGGWDVDLDGQVCKVDKSKKPTSLSLLTPEDLRDDNDNFDLNTNLLDLYPDPVHFVRFLKEIDRVDISSEIFVKLLGVYRDQKGNDDTNPVRTLLYLQIIMQMQTQLSDGNSSSNILCKPTHLLSFIKHVLDPTTTSPEKNQVKTANNAQSSVLLYPEEDQNLSDEGDSDDDTPGADIITPDIEMIETSVNLLLSILEANEDLSARTAPVLNDIFSLLEPLARGGSPTITPLAREARMVMTARLASTSSLGRSYTDGQETESAQKIYQKALKLLQDPILPVRAHGLLLLRQLVTPSTKKESKEPKLENHALVPAILSIFLQSVQDDDSYVFLNAVQGLAAMVDTFGKDVLRGLMKEYAEGLDGLGAMSLTQHDLDIRIRVGEALSSVIRRCGDALGIYVDILVPSLFNILRSQHIPTTLRTSSLSLLAECETTSPLAMLPYVTDLANAMIDLLQIETVPTQPQSSRNAVDEDVPATTMDTEPLSVNPKFPPFRRAALHFLSLVIRETTKQAYDSSFERPLFPVQVLNRAKTTLSYVASTDEDNIVRMMAREARDGLNQLFQAVVDEQ